MKGDLLETGDVEFGPSVDYYHLKKCFSDRKNDGKRVLSFVSLLLSLQGSVAATIMG